jgi:hypothetical protein
MIYLKIEHRMLFLNIFYYPVVCGSSYLGTKSILQGFRQEIRKDTSRKDHNN